MTDGGKTLRIERTFQAPAEAVFDAWTSEEVLRRWWHVEDSWEASEASVDLRVGGVVRVVMRDTATADQHGGRGEFIEISRPTRLAFTWIWDNDPDRRMLIELDFEETDGATLVRFTHSNLPDDQSVRDHDDGWRRMFERLAGVLAASASR